LRRFAQTGYPIVNQGSGGSQTQEQKAATGPTVSERGV